MNMLFGTIATTLFSLAYPRAIAQSSLQFTNVQRIANQEVLLSLTAPAGINYHLQISSNLIQWNNWMTFAGAAGTLSRTDSAAPFFLNRFYRAAEAKETNLLSGDHVVTPDGDILIHPVNHASFVLSWKGQWIYNDPVVAGSASFSGIPKANLILISHSHTDHFDSTTLNAVRSPSTLILAPRAVYDAMSTTLKVLTTVLTNGSSTNVGELRIDAIPMYNTTPDRLTRHPKGFGNGYILTIANRRFYMSGDTEDIPEMRALRDIDIAFLCMSLPSNMTVQQAADAVREFQPKVVYPYHFTASDPAMFKKLVGIDLGIEVRLRKWY
jgi:L-ascorbate metabolism protein UlaG (beta-lactamase superfamily)